MERIESGKNLIIEYCLLTFVILWSGGYVAYGLFPNWQYVLFILALYVMLKRGLRIEREIYLGLGVFAIVSILQSIIFSGPITSVVQPITRLVAVAMVAVIVRPNLNHVFISITTAFAFFSLIFWGLDITPDGHSLLLSIAKDLPQYGAKVLNEQNYEKYGYVYTLYFYTISETPFDAFGFLIRNSGPFFEPGRFTIVLTIALALILYSENYQRYKFQFYIILLANLTSLSTTGYLSMIVLFAGYYGNRSSSDNIRGVIMFMIFLLGAYFLMGLSFMGEKISIALGDTDTANSRFGAMFYHWLQIKQSPWIGYGSFLEKSFLSLEMSPCGITDLMRKWGIPVFVMCVWLLTHGTHAYLKDKPLYKISFVTILLFMAYTQTIMNDPLFYLLYFIGGEEYIYDDEEIYEDDLEEEELYPENIYAAEI